jgi:hypothetical protein
MNSNIWLSIFLAALFLWAFSSAKVNKLAHSGEGILALPLFVLQGPGIFVVTVINLILSLSQLALTVYIFINFWFLQALVILGLAILFVVIAQVVLVSLKIPMILQYFLCAVITIIVGIRVLAS